MRPSPAFSTYISPSGPNLTSLGVQSPVLAVVGGQDAFTPPDQARAVLDRISGPVDLQVYDAGHAFFNDENLLGTYDEAKARQAWAETVGFLRRQLAG